MKQLLFFIFVFCVISNTYASDECLHRPGCEELGYTQTRKKCACFNKDVLPCPFNIKDDNTVFCGDLPCKEKCEAAYPLFSGKENTKAAVDYFGNKALAAYAATQFYVGDKDGDFGQGKWYLPSIGEWMDFYGTDTSLMTAGEGTSGAIANNRKMINAALNTLANKGAQATALDGTFHWTSSLQDGVYAWTLAGNGGFRSKSGKSTYSVPLRCSLLLKNCFTLSSNRSAPKVGDVMYEDKTWGSAADYDGSKTPVGVHCFCFGNQTRCDNH